MLESVTIFTPGGLLLYQYVIPITLFHDPIAKENNVQYTNLLLNDILIHKILYKQANDNNNNETTTTTTTATTTSTTTTSVRNLNYYVQDGVTYVWKFYSSPTAAQKNTINHNNNYNNTDRSFYVVLIYPDIVFDGPRTYLKKWAEMLLTDVINEYKLFYDNTEMNYNSTRKQQQQQQQEESSPEDEEHDVFFIRPDPLLFDKTFHLLLENSKTSTTTTTSSSSSMMDGNSNVPQQQLLENREDNPDLHNNNTLTQQQHDKKATKNKVGKEKRNWHDGTAKVTDKAMAELDKSNKKESGTAEDAYQRALQEARQAYLPTPEDYDNDPNNNKRIVETTDDENSASSSSTSYFTSFFQGITGSGNRIIAEQDLIIPCQQMAELLKSKNVATTIANDITASIQQQLIGKRLKTFYSIETAIKQALETSLNKLLFTNTTNTDLLRNVLLKKETDNSLFNRATNNKNRRPYVVTVMGINGIGKTTTIAKLAYYFQQNNINPMLVACDTFRSGAVEQLKIHADCLNVQFFTQGYSKDPSTVASAAIAHAQQYNNNTATATNGKMIDVILIDTAGRMQNNVPLMKALGKLVYENQPDCCILVCEALVGHDGLNQFDMFHKAASTNANAGSFGRANNNSTRRGGIDGLILTKFDTVDTKVGASLTLTYETQTPILFVGIGQKYHHLTKLSVPMVVNSLFSNNKK